MLLDQSWCLTTGTNMSKSLTPTRIEALKPRSKVYKAFDGGGLHILVKPSRGKYWRLLYRFSGIQMALRLGVYDREANSLTHARAARVVAKLTLRPTRCASA